MNVGRSMTFFQEQDCTKGRKGNEPMIAAIDSRTENIPTKPEAEKTGLSGDYSEPRQGIAQKRSLMRILLC